MSPTQAVTGHTPAARPDRLKRRGRRWGGRVSALTILQFVLLPVLVVAFIPPAAADVLGSSGSGYYTVQLDPTTRIEVTSRVTPSNIQPGEPISVKWTVSTTHSGSVSPGTECVTGDNNTQTGALTTAIFHRVGTGGSYWNQAAGFEVYHPAVSGTQFQRNQWLCGPPRLETEDTWDFVVPGSSTAELPPGCYHVSVVNQHLHTSDNSDGTIAAFTVGDGSCTTTTEIDVTANFDHLGAKSKTNFSLTGFDRAAVTGEGASRVARVCVRSDWTATIKLKAPTSTPLFWNIGQTFPFTDEQPESGEGVIWIGVTRSAPEIIDGVPKFDRSYFETIRMEYCAAGPEAILRRAPLTVTGPGKMVSIEHRTAALAYGVNGNLLGSVTTATETAGKKKVLSMSETVTQSFKVS